VIAGHRICKVLMCTDNNFTGVCGMYRWTGHSFTCGAVASLSAKMIHCLVGLLRALATWWLLNGRSVSLLEYTGDSLVAESAACSNAVVFLSQLGLLSTRLTGNSLTGGPVACWSAPMICWLADQQLDRICWRLLTVLSLVVWSEMMFFEWWGCCLHDLNGDSWLHCGV
jgi:hypothetical protein